MNSSLNSIPLSPLDSQPITASPSVPAHPFLWSVRRELWEHRYIFIAPLAVAALFLVGFSISTVHLPQKMHALSALDQMQQHELVQKPYDFASLLIMGSTFFITFYYCLEALYAERRDRSILFWKSLPVSDATTVLAKATIPIVVIPLLTFAITILTQLIMLLLSSMVLLGSGTALATLWSHLPFWHMFMMLLYHLVFVHGLSFAPIWCWLLLISVWARRAPFLWAAIPPLVIIAVERITFNSSHFLSLLSGIVGGNSDEPANAAGHMSLDAMTPGPGQLLSSPGLWIGLLFAAAFLAAAMRLRRYREPV
jgi:ABC-2 type transport system permease protein